MIKDMYHKFIPDSMRKKIRKLRYAKFRKDVIRYLKKYEDEGNSEYKDIRLFFERHPDEVDVFFPYEFIMKYKNPTITVYHDETPFPYVLHNGRKLYGKRNWSNEQLVEYYNGLLLEQDAESPHRYLFSNRMPEKGSVLADVGAAEGIFTLDVIGYVQKSYLFECDFEWIEALRLTFEPEIQTGKVEIIDAFVGATNDVTKKTLTLDSFFLEKQIDYVKADIEGVEEDMLAGGQQVFSKKVNKVLLCCYHRQDAEQSFRSYLVEKQFTHIEVNPHWMIWVGYVKTAPYLRHGVLYASKN